VSYGSTGTGTSPHLLMEEISAKTGVQFLHALQGQRGLTLASAAT
jgi:tripartite-type tricarboxylate transporter receptor subunit TctC